MKNVVLSVTCAALALSLVACGGKANKKTSESKTQTENKVPEYRVLDNPQVNLDEFAKDENGYISIFDGKTFKGWRGYGKDVVPGKWTIEDGCIKFNGTGGGEAQDADGGDLIFAHKFKNFELTFEWKVDKGSNSGILYLAQEVEAKDPQGNWRMEPIYISAPEAQILDNENHPDAKLGVKGNRKLGSLYDLIPAPANKPFRPGFFNTATIVVKGNHVEHWLNGVKLLEYERNNQMWNALVAYSKYKNWPNFGNAVKGNILLQDHGDEVWYQNIKIKEL